MDIYSAMYPVNFMSRILGLSSLTVLGQPGSRHFYYSRKLTYYNIFIITFFAILTVVKVTLFLNQEDHSFFRSVRAIEYASIIATNLIIRLACLLQRHKIKLFYKKLMKIDENLPNMKQTYKKVFLRHVYVILVTFVLLLFYFICRCLLHTISNDLGLFSSILGCLFVIISACTNNMQIIYFTSSVYVISERFRALRATIANSAALLELTHSASTDNTQLSETHSVNARKVLLSPLKTKLEVAVKLHSLLCNSASLLNSAFSVQILFIVGFSFVTITYNSYFCVVSLLHQSKGLFGGTAWNVVSLYSLILTLLSNTILISSCDSASNEVSYLFLLPLSLFT
jgi:hypothetical protein